MLTPPKPHAARLLCAFGAIASAGCGGSNTALPPQPPPAHAAPAAEKPVESGAVHVLEPGAEPRRLLGAHPREGSRHTTDLLFTTSTNVLGDAAKRVKRPHMASKIHLVANLSVTGVADTRSAWRYEIARAEALPFEGMSDAFVAGVASSLAPAQGATGTFFMLSNGRVDDFDVGTVGLSADDAANRTKMADLLMKMVSSQLPEQAVGDGARWTLLREDGQTTECRLSAGVEPVVRCRGTLRMANGEGDMNGDVEFEQTLDRDSGMTRVQVMRSLLHMRGPTPESGEPLPMETRIESRLEVR
jgi:hypothetical protein